MRRPLKKAISQEWFQQSYDELIRLTQLMNDMEKLPEAEGAHFTIHIRCVNMVQLAQNVQRNFQQIAESKGIKLIFCSY
ncbi:hypothetical protein B1748_05235 [Paenibacillus sp. MY03]|nr:hypothetical protein B1748_05235 [Paenibacillus sp. MY03]